MNLEQTVNLECRILDELTDDAAARSPGVLPSQPVGKSTSSTRVLTELIDDAAPTTRNGVAAGTAGPLIGPALSELEGCQTTRNVRAHIASGSIKAAIFDGYGTLVDWVPTIRGFLLDYVQNYFPDDVQQRAGRVVNDPGADIDSDLLLEKYDQIRRNVQISHPTALYPEILRRSLDEFSRYFGVEPVPAEGQKFAEGPGVWPAFEDSHALLTRLREKGFVVAAISNIDNASFRYTCEHVLEFRFDEVVTAEDVGAYKPDPRLLDAMLTILGERNIQADQIVLISQSLYADHKPAGDHYPSILRVHVNRPNSVLGLKLDDAPTPDMEVCSLAEFERNVFGRR